MRKDRMLDPSKPALILTYGSCPGKIRPLDRDLLVIGRAPACDLVLNSPEVSPVHCLIIKTAAGWIVRNTNPRAGTQVNGRSIQDERLCDDDCLQIGTFTFKLHLPNADDVPGLPFARQDTKRLQAARQKVVRLAWNLRRRLLQNQAVLKTERQALAQRNAELDQRTHAVDARQRECENLLLLVEEQEEEVNDQRQSLIEAATTFEAFRRETQEKFARQAAEAEIYIQNTWEQCRTRQCAVEQLAVELQAKQQDAAALVPGNADLASLRAENEQLRQQLAERPPVVEDQTPALRNELGLVRLLLNSREEAIGRMLQEKGQVQKEDKGDNEELKNLRDLLAASHAELQRLQEQETVWKQQAAQLDEQRDELAGLREQLRTKDEELRQSPTAGASLTDDEQAELVAAVETLLRENEEYRLQLLEPAGAVQDTPRPDERVESPQAEIAPLRAQVQFNSEEADFGSHAENGGKETTAPIKPNKYLRLENEQLRELTKSLQQEAAALREQLKARSGTTDDDEDLPDGSQLLAEERARLETQLGAVLQERNELDAAVHAAELQIAKERSEITRAWAELNGKREEFRMELEKEKRDNIRTNLERVRRIKEEAQIKRFGNAAVLASQKIGERVNGQ